MERVGIIILGSNGGVGRAVTRAVKESGYSTICVSRKPDPGNSFSDVSILGDCSQQAFWDEILDVVDFIAYDDDYKKRYFKYAYYQQPIRLQSALRERKSRIQEDKRLEEEKRRAEEREMKRQDEIRRKKKEEDAEQARRQNAVEEKLKVLTEQKTKKESEIKKRYTEQIEKKKEMAEKYHYELDIEKEEKEMQKEIESLEITFTEQIKTIQIDRERQKRHFEAVRVLLSEKQKREEAERRRKEESSLLSEKSATKYIVVGIIICTGCLDLVPLQQTSLDVLTHHIQAHVHPSLLALRFASVHWPLCVVMSMGSTCCEEGEGDACAYVVAKHALLGLKRSADEDLWGLPLKFEVIFPGNIKTPMWEKAGVQPPEDCVDVRGVAVGCVEKMVKMLEGQSQYALEFLEE
ncbi:hypothetical protein ADUPG1_012700 [Aduncisulcus paluster]|uniref:Uncharacterized protein n=1 Tax=Aduncisulcus paluster TaxID=2918883 RepID=A0ABQ5K0D7_9EUKA|nr:hypothetical protein ADUPG1_012700 [Aduncisulcus paluster]|eukprot:gnl/Carplike_NY0171/5079_a6930_214.p1 GENE.gnl/Carplike_NY0171/5079_a6930_214~~gnl/Carplike_NY0171/5079_a6930_214.p1  ORF type:complete len:407 (+),score=112.83 gnl/Carplike_NY0171/5079_a6930_214:56-1276(+)